MFFCLSDEPSTFNLSPQDGQQSYEKENDNALTLPEDCSEMGFLNGDLSFDIASMFDPEGVGENVILKDIAIGKIYEHHK